MPDSVLKILSDSGSSFKVGGYGVVFGGQDLTKDRFTADTDFWLDRITQNPPVLYQHGQDDVVKRTVVGRVVSTKPDDVGLWVEAQITAASKYADAIRQLIAKGVLGWSSGSVTHLVQRVKSTTAGVAEITSWPIVELSLTPTPAEPRTVGVKELKMLATSDPLLVTIARDAELAAAKEAKVAMVDLPDTAFAFVEDGGTLIEAKTHPLEKRHYLHHDESGAVDADLLDGGIEEALKSANPAGLAHLIRHQHAIAHGHEDDAHTSKWADGTAASGMAVAALKLSRLSDDAAEDHVAMERTGIDTKSGKRIIASRRDQLKALHAAIGYLTENADGIERGDDGTAQVDLYRAAFDLLSLEEAA